jgi:hypothetical protein
LYIVRDPGLGESNRITHDFMRNGTLEELSDIFRNGWAKGRFLFLLIVFATALLATFKWKRLNIFRCNLLFLFSQAPIHFSLGKSLDEQNSSV